METMTAVRARRFGGPEVLALEKVPKPVPKAGEVLVRIKATSVNPIDWKLREGFFKELPLPFTPGGDFAGIVEKTGEGVDDVRPGEEVYGAAPGSMGAQAEYVACPAGQLAPKPRTLDFVAAASVPLAAMTAWQALFEHGGLRADQTVLILGGSGGVGSFAVQLAKQAGAKVLATASADAAGKVGELGADRVIDYEREKLEDAARDVDLCVDLVGGEFQNRAFACLRRGGRLVSAVNPPDAARGAEKGVDVRMFRMRPKAGQLREIGRRIDARQLKVEVAKVLPLEKADEAQSLNQRHEVSGKIVLTVGS